MSKILVIPDSHATPGISNDRFEWLGNLISEIRPDKIVNIDDMADMPSLCSYEKGKRSFEGRRYWKDVQSVIDAQTRLFAPINRLNQSLKSAKKKLYKPELHLTIGNHTHRIDRATQLDPVLHGTISIDDLKLKEFGWNVHPYKEIVEIDGIYFSHFFTKGLMDGTISGSTHTLAANILKEMKDNAVCGHSHLLSLANSVLPSGRKVWGISVGCYFDHKVDYVSTKAQSEWWRGVVVLDVHNREIKDIGLISLETIKKEYK